MEWQSVRLRAIVAVTAPRLGETLFDPAVGSAGFLCESFDYLRAQNPKRTTAQDRALQERTFYGKEKKSLAYVIAIMNMILHGIEAPNIIHTNTLAETHRAGPKSVWVMLVSAWLTWFMALSEAANAWWGANQMLPIAAKQAGAAGAAAWQEAVVKLCHLPAALGLILSVTLLIIGIVKHRGAAEPEAAP